jgi:hypothetical protein
MKRGGLKDVNNCLRILQQRNFALNLPNVVVTGLPRSGGEATFTTRRFGARPPTPTALSSQPPFISEQVRCTVNLCLVTIKYKNPSWTNITVPQKYVFDFKE